MFAACDLKYLQPEEEVAAGNLFLNPTVLTYISQRLIESMNEQESTLMDLGLDIIRY